MAISTVDWDTYNALRCFSIDHPEVDAALAEQGTEVTKPVGGWRLAHTSSWARWGFGTRLATPVTAVDKAAFERLQPLTTSVVLFAVNWGGTAFPKDPQEWRTFHTPGHAGDCKLRCACEIAMERTGFEAAPYMSDVFKLMPTSDAGKLRQVVTGERARGRDPVGRNIHILQKELEFCQQANGGSAPVVVALGSAAFGWLAGRVGGPTTKPRGNPIATEMSALLGGASIFHVPHYTRDVASVDELAAHLISAFTKAMAPLKTV